MYSHNKLLSDGTKLGTGSSQLASNVSRWFSLLWVRIASLSILCYMYLAGVSANALIMLWPTV